MSRDNLPKPTTPFEFTPKPFDSSVDSKTLDAADYQQLLVDQQWRDVAALKINLEYPDSINQDAAPTSGTGTPGN